MSTMADSSEMLGPETPGQFRLIACPSLSHERRTDRYFAPGRSIGTCLRELGWQTEGLHARVFIDGHYITDAEWETATPHDGQAVVERRIPTGGQGGGKQALQIVAMLALVVAAGYVGGGGLAAGSWFLEGSMSAKVLAAGLLVSGSLALNGRIPAPLPRRSLPVRTLPEAA